MYAYISTSIDALWIEWTSISLQKSGLRRQRRIGRKTQRIFINRLGALNCSRANTKIFKTERKTFNVVTMVITCGGRHETCLRIRKQEQELESQQKRTYQEQAFQPIYNNSRLIINQGDEILILVGLGLVVQSPGETRTRENERDDS